jgi:hypothetical protein
MPDRAAFYTANLKFVGDASTSPDMIPRAHSGEP